MESYLQQCLQISEQVLSPSDAAEIHLLSGDVADQPEGDFFYDTMTHDLIS